MLVDSWLHFIEIGIQKSNYGGASIAAQAACSDSLATTIQSKGAARMRPDSRLKATQAAI